MKHDQNSIPKELTLVADREERSVIRVYNKRNRKCLFFTLIKRKVVRRMSFYCQSCMLRPKLQKTSERSSAYTQCMITQDVDVVDLLSTTHSTPVKSRKYSLNALAFILDICGLNTKTILQDNGIKLTNFETTYNLGKN